jgi:hypothetical protein
MGMAIDDPRLMDNVAKINVRRSRHILRFINSFSLNVEIQYGACGSTHGVRN